LHLIFVGYLKDPTQAQHNFTLELTLTARNHCLIIMADELLFECALVGTSVPVD
jgi:hypothetical protein